jgi:hypothetical protein
MGLRTTLLVAGSLAMTVGRSSHAQTPAAAPPPISVGGVLYTHYQYSLRSDSAGNHANNFDVARVYLTATARLAKGVGGRLTVESFRPTSTSGIETRIKYAFAQYTPEKSPVSFKLGQLQTPYVEFDERLWDYRAQGTVAMDRNGYLSSTDLGVTVEGSWRDEGINFSAGLFNGETFRSAPGDHHKDVAARVSVRLLRSDDMSQVGGLRLTGFALEGEPTRGGSRRRWLGQLSYRSTQAMIAGQLGATRDRVDSTLSAPTTSARVARRSQCRSRDPGRHRRRRGEHLRRRPVPHVQVLYRRARLAPVRGIGQRGDRGRLQGNHVRGRGPRGLRHPQV